MITDDNSAVYNDYAYFYYYYLQIVFVLLYCIGLIGFLGKHYLDVVHVSQLDKDTVLICHDGELSFFLFRSSPSRQVQASNYSTLLDFVPFP